MSTYYFVCYEYRPKADALRLPSRGNIILKDGHPVEWVASRPVLHARDTVTCLHFWSEIPEDVAKRAARTIEIHDVATFEGTTRKMKPYEIDEK